MSDTFDYTDNSAPAAPTTSSAKKQPSVLDKLREEVSKHIERPEVYIRVPERPSIVLKFSPNITQNQLNAWRRNAGENTKQGMDATKFACFVVGHSCRGILIDDEEVLGDNDAPMTFASPEILEMLDVTRPMPEGVRAMFGLDPHVEAAALAIMEAAGYSDSVDTVDPT